MARRRKRRKRYSRQDKGMLHDVTLYYKSKSRRKGVVVGLLAAPLLMAYTKFGADSATWFVSTIDGIFNRSSDAS